MSLRGEIQFLGNLLKGKRRPLIQHGLYVEKQRRLNYSLGRSVGHTAGDLRQIAGAYPNTVGIEIDIVAVRTQLLLQSEELAI